MSDLLAGMVLVRIPELAALRADRAALLAVARAANELRALADPATRAGERWTIAVSGRVVDRFVATVDALPAPLREEIERMT